MALEGRSVLFIALMCPTVAFSLGYKMFKPAHNVAEPITGLIIMEASDDRVDCSSLGDTWSLAGPGLMMSPLSHGNSLVAPKAGLCIERDPQAHSVITGISFAVVQAEGAEAASSLLSMVVSLSSANTTEDAGVTKDPAEHCNNLGGSWALIRGHVAPVATSTKVHVCAESLPRAQVGTQEWITNIAPYSLNTAWQTSCASTVASSRAARVKVPAMDVEAFYDNPLLLCVDGGKHVPGAAPQNHTAIAFTESEPSRHEHIPIGNNMFHKLDLNVATDTGNRSRNHIFVIGPETSGTRLWSKIMQASTGIVADPEDFAYNNQAAVFHLSLPSGMWCGPEFNVPNYLDFGGSSISYRRVKSATAYVITSHLEPRFNVQPLDLVRNHRTRGDDATVLLIARDPRASFAGKMHHHCKVEAFGVAEQREAYRLMLDAARANDSNIHVICYEDMLSKGSEYIRSKFREMHMVPGHVPEIVDANAKYNLDGLTCESDMLAYAELCPNTELGQSIRSTCHRTYGHSTYRELKSPTESRHIK